MPKKLKKAAPVSASSAPASPSRIPIISSSSSSSPISLRTRATPVLAQTTGVEAHGELGTGGGSDTASLRGVSVAESNSSNHSRKASSSTSSPMLGSSQPQPSSSLLSQSQPTPNSRPASFAEPPEESALETLRKRIEVDEEARRKVAAEAVEKVPRKLRKRSKPGPRKEEDEVKREEGEEEDGESVTTTTMMMEDEDEDEDEEEPASSLYDEHPPAHNSILDPLPAPPAPSQPVPARSPPTTTEPPSTVDLLLFLPRLSLSLTQSTLRLPFRLASHLPLVGPLVPFSPQQQRDDESKIYQTAELGLGLILAGLMLSLAGVEWAWGTVVRGRRREQRRGTKVRFQ